MMWVMGKAHIVTTQFFRPTQQGICIRSQMDPTLFEGPFLVNANAAKKDGLPI